MTYTADQARKDQQEAEFQSCVSRNERSIKEAVAKAIGRQGYERSIHVEFSRMSDGNVNSDPGALRMRKHLEDAGYKISPTGTYSMKATW